MLRVISTSPATVAGKTCGNQVPQKLYGKNLPICEMGVGICALIYYNPQFGSNGQ